MACERAARNRHAAAAVAEVRGGWLSACLEHAGLQRGQQRVRALEPRATFAFVALAARLRAGVGWRYLARRTGGASRRPWPRDPWPIERSRTCGGRGLERRVRRRIPCAGHALMRRAGRALVARASVGRHAFLHRLRACRPGRQYGSGEYDNRKVTIHRRLLPRSPASRVRTAGDVGAHRVATSD